MAHPKYVGSKGASLLTIAVIVLYAMTAVAQNATDICRPASVIPLASRGVVVIQYCAQNLHLVPVFGPNALSVSPRIGQIHVRVDDASWVWADASGNPIILMGLPPARTNCSLNWRTRTTTP